MISGRCTTRYDIADGSVVGGVPFGRHRKMCENMIWASLRASNGNNRIERASSYRMSSWMMQVTS